MQRRAVLKAGLGFALRAGLPVALSPTARANESVKLIDAHCHIFNSEDLPVIGFLEKVAAHGRLDLGKYPRLIRQSIDYVINELVDLARQLTVDAATEADKLKDGDKLIRGKTADYRVALALVRQIKNLAGQSWPRLKKSRRGTFNKHISNIFTPAIANEAYGQIRMELFPSQYGFGPGLKNPYAYDDEPPEGEIADGLLDNPGPISKAVRWAIGFTNARIQLARKLNDLAKGRTVLATPALIDYTHWLNDDFNVKLDDQVRAMGEIARIGAQCRIHGYAPFDPLRQALFAIGQEKSGSSLGRIEKAVFEHGFVGVKLYPPMGFRPLGNIRISNAEFHRDFPHLARKYPKLKIGEALDKALRALYGWCEVNQVPIMAHAAHSNGVSESAMNRAAPEYWGDVAKAYPNLKVMLAHFGDFEQGLEPGKNLSDTWEYRIATQMRSHANIFADISYFHSVFVERNKAPFKEMLRMFGTTAHDFGGLLSSRLVYGSDWEMLGVEDKFEPVTAGSGYPAKVEEILRLIENVHPTRVKGRIIQQKTGRAFDDAAIRAIFSTNAASFLGLGTSGRPKGNRARLEAFYAKHALDASWMHQFDNA